MTALPHIVLVDDDNDLTELMRDYLSRNGMRISIVRNANELDNILATQRVDVVVLDLMLPGEDGLSVCRRLCGRERIIVLSGADSEADRVVALEMGADDFVTKPGSARELLARIRALVRRSGVRASASMGASAAGAFDLGNGWRFDAVGRSVRAPDGTVIGLTTAEFDLMRTFLRHPQKVMSRDALAAQIGGETRARAIDVQVSRLRHKLDAHALGASLIRTVRNAGYIFVAPVPGV